MPTSMEQLLAQDPTNPRLRELADQLTSAISQLVKTKEAIENEPDVDADSGSTGPKPSSRPHSVRKNKPQRCSNCGSLGHKVRTCPQTQQLQPNPTQRAAPQPSQNVAVSPERYQEATLLAAASGLTTLVDLGARMGGAARGQGGAGGEGEARPGADEDHSSPPSRSAMPPLAEAATA